MKGFTKYWFVDYSKVYIKSDIGLVIEGVETIQSQKFNNFRSSFLIEGQFARIDIQPTFENTKVTRKYMKIPKIIAEVGGFMSIILILAKFLSATFIKFDMELNLINQLVNFRSVNKYIRKQDQKPIENSMNENSNFLTIG